VRAVARAGAKTEERRRRAGADEGLGKKMTGGPGRSAAGAVRCTLLGWCAPLAAWHGDDGCGPVCVPRFLCGQQNNMQERWWQGSRLLLRWCLRSNERRRYGCWALRARGGKTDWALHVEAAEKAGLGLFACSSLSTCKEKRIKVKEKLRA